MSIETTTRQPIPIGESDFRKIREAGKRYIDKSLFIQDVINASAEVLLLPRPRRFGKTLNLSMLRYFFERCDENYGDLFNDLTITQQKEFQHHQGRYPVIYLSFKDLKDTSWEAVSRRLYRLIAAEIMRFEEIVTNAHVSVVDRNLFRHILTGEATPDEYEDSLRLLSQYLCRHHDEKAVILIDEYDAPILSGYSD